MFSSRPAWLRGADKALEGRAKIVNAIEREEAKLLEIVIARVEADRALEEAQTAEALGETAADIARAQKNVDEALAAIGRQAILLGGLRSRLAGMAPDLEGHVRAVEAKIPAHIEGLRADFAAEWAKGVAAFGTLLGKRAAAEVLTGKMDLPVPQAEACDLGDAGEPRRAIQGLRAALDEIAGWNRAATWPEVDAMGPGGSRAYDPTAVYVITNSAGGGPVGTLAVDASFVPGMLNHLVHIGYAVPLKSREWRNSLEAGARIVRALESEEQAATAQRKEDEAWRSPGYDREKGLAAAEFNARKSNTEVPCYTGDKLTI